VVIVHQEPAAGEAMAEAIHAHGHTVRLFTDPMPALDALEHAEQAELLITCVQFPPGKPNGRSLAMMARMRRREIKLVFLTASEEEQYVCDLGECVPLPADVPKLAELAERLLGRKSP
jgi:CheY-like chemotaxis protein